MIIDKYQTRIVKLIQLAPNGIFESRIKLQKILYLLKQASINKGKDKVNISFSLYNFGPFSFDLAKNVTNYVNIYKIIKEKQENGECSPWVYSIDKDLIENVENLDNYTYEDLFGLNEVELKAQFDKLYNKDNKLLELTATIVFLANDMSKKIRGVDELKEKVRVIKPHLMQMFDEAYGLAKEYFIVIN